MSQTAEKKIVLVVEDDSTYLHLWERLLQEMGVQHHYRLAKNSTEALQILENENVDLLISDVLLDHCNGYELAKTARKKNPRIDILLTTGYATDLSRFDLVGLKCHLLHKPYYNLTDVCLLLKHLLEGSNVFANMDEDSFSENEDHPEITEWIL